MEVAPILAGLLVLVSAGASFFFALAETALFSLSRLQVRQLTQRNGRAAEVVVRLLSEPQDLLATMVLLGMNRVAVRDGSISAKVMFRAAANEAAKVGYASGSDPQSVSNWGERGSLTYGGTSSTMVL